MTDELKHLPDPECPSCGRYSIAQLAAICNRVAKDKGWWDKPRSFGDVVALIHSEVSEALEAHRKGEADCIGKVLEEFADVMIRILDLIGHNHIGRGFEEILVDKVKKNLNRPYRHGNKRL